ncbi:MAG: BON domain-containing protein [Isosphaeraceae bacterium]
MTTTDASSHATNQEGRGSCLIRMTTQRRLEASGYGVLRWICCEFDQGVLHLKGWVPTNYLKQIAQAIAIEVEGVIRVNNQIRVGSADAKTAAEPKETATPSGADHQ